MARNGGEATNIAAGERGGHYFARLLTKSREILPLGCGHWGRGVGLQATNCRRWGAWTHGLRRGVADAVGATRTGLRQPQFVRRATTGPGRSRIRWPNSLPADPVSRAIRPTLGAPITSSKPGLSSYSIHSWRLRPPRQPSALLPYCCLGLF